jgi:hypothetical protein
MELIITNIQEGKIEQEIILIWLEEIKKLITKLYEILKAHLLELTELVFFLEFKVHSIISRKINDII